MKSFRRVAALLVACFLPAGSVAVVAGDAAPAFAVEKPAKRPDPALAPVDDVPGLPRVLLVGDSISMGYTIPTRKLLEGKANVHRIPVNGGPTTRGVEQIEKWLGTSPWDVIHFNFGLHDIKRVDDAGGSVDAATGHRQVELEAYRENLRVLVKRLKRTGATLIWCSTTPVPKGSKGRAVGDEVAYNVVAARVMQEEGVEINDLHAFASPRMAEIGKPADVHYTPQGSRVLAEQVATRIENALLRRKEKGDAVTRGLGPGCERP